MTSKNQGRPISHALKKPWKLCAGWTITTAMSITSRERSNGSAPLIDFTAKGCIKPFSVGALTGLDTYHEDFYQYLELARKQPTSVTSGDMGSEICYESPKGFCAQRTAWIHHLLANDFYEEAMATADPHVRAAKLKRAGEHAREARKYRRPEGGVGFDQGTDTVALQQKITEALSAMGLRQ